MALVISFSTLKWGEGVWDGQSTHALGWICRLAWMLSINLDDSCGTYKIFLWINSMHKDGLSYNIIGYSPGASSSM